nr:hypothetical protein [Tanacetum cinerariifolium]
EEESFDPIPRTPEDGKDDGNGEEDQGMESIFTAGSSTVTPIPSPQSTMTPSIISTSTTASQLPIPPTPIPSLDLQNLPTFASVFHFEDRVKSLEVNFSNIPGIVQQYMHQQMPEAVREAVQTQTDQLQDSIQRENDEFLKTIDDNMKKIIEEQVKTQVKAQVTRIFPRIEEEDVRRMMIRKDPSLDQTRGLRDKEKEGSMHQLALHLNQLPGVQAGLLQGLNLDSCLPVSMLLQRNLCRLPVRWRNPHIQCLKQNKTLPAAQGNAQSWISALAKQTDARSLFNELLDTPIDFSNFIMNQLGVDTLTPELLAGPTYELMRGSCNSLTELEYHLEEVYKATMDQLDWANPEGQQYSHNLLQPLPLIPDNRGRCVILFEHFINNDLEYLRGGASSRKYTTSVTKTKAADYRHIKWIEDLVPRNMWIQEPLNYDKHALWGVSHWGRKRQQFYGFAINRESALDVYSKRRIIAVTDLKIVE